MGEPKPFASLSSGLLARKGMAKPAMRPQGFGQMGASVEDLGWNDMGYAPPVPAAQTPREAEMPQHVPSKISALTPAPKPGEPRSSDEDEGDEEEFESAVHSQQRLIEESFKEAKEEARSEERRVGKEC